MVSIASVHWVQCGSSVEDNTDPTMWPIVPAILGWQRKGIYYFLGVRNLVFVRAMNLAYYLCSNYNLSIL